MLDQNTDRMWFVIGAVIVGAAIIFIANGSLPTLFASVTDTFEDSVSDWQQSHYVNDMDGNMIERLGIIKGWFINPRAGEMSNSNAATDYAATAYMDVVGGETYLFSTTADTYKYVLFYDANDEPILERYGLGSIETKAVDLEVVAPVDAKQVRIATRYRYTEGQNGSPENQDVISNWWFGLKSDYPGRGE